MAYTFEQVFAVDEANPGNVAQNGSVLIFAPGDAAKTPLTITTTDGQPLANPVQVNANGFGPAFMHATLDRVAWEGGGFTGFFTSYEGMKDEAVAARSAAENAAANAAAAAEADLAARIAAGEFKGDKGADGSNVLPTDTAIKDAIANPASATRGALNATYASKGVEAQALGRPLTIALLGDSITNQNSTDSGTGLVNYEAKGYFTWANILNNQRWTLITPSNAAVGEYGGSGLTAAQLIADGHADAAAASTAEHVIVVAGTNDAPTRTAADIAADLLTIWRKQTAKGKRVIACTIPPRALTADTEATRTVIRDANRLIRANAATEPGIILCDWYAAIVDPATGKANLDYTYDEIHPDSTGASRMGKVLADVLASISPATRGPLPADAVDAKSLMPNPFMTGNVSGLATSTNAYILGAGVYTASKVTRTDAAPGEWQQLAVTSAPAPNLDGVQIQQQNTAVGVDWAIGDTVYAVAEFETDAASWAIRHMQLSLNFFGPNTGPTAPANNGSDKGALTAPMLRPERGIIRTPALVIPANTTRLQLNFYVYGAGTIRIGRWDVIKA